MSFPEVRLSGPVPTFLRSALPAFHDATKLRKSERNFRLTTSVPVFDLFIELAVGTLLRVGLKIRLSEDPAEISVKLARPMR